MEWYLMMNPQVSASQLIQVEYGDLSGILSPDGLSAYLSDPLKSKIYSFEYIMDQGSKMKYPTIIKLIIKRFALIQIDNSSTTSPLINESSSSATSTN